MSVNRKVYKKKRHSCALCKPHKMGREPRAKEWERLLAKTQHPEMAAPADFSL
jgi:hypothetical protein